MITLLLLMGLAFAPQRNNATPKSDARVSPEQMLGWQLEGLTQEALREDVTNRGLTDYPEIAFLSALLAAGADQKTIRVVRHAKGPRRLWKWDFGLPKPTHYLYEVAGALLWGDLDSALATMQKESAKQPRNPDVRLIYAHLLRVQGDWIAAYGEASEAVKLGPQFPYAHALQSTVEMRPEDAAACIVLGHARELRGEDQEALQAYERAENLHPEYSAIYAGMATG